jgi:hypothetical protein
MANQWERRRGAFEAADAELRGLIREGFEQGMPGDQLAQAAGLSVPRVYQIRDGRQAVVITAVSHSGQVISRSRHQVGGSKNRPDLQLYWCAILGLNQEGCIADRLVAERFAGRTAASRRLCTHRRRAAHQRATPQTATMALRRTRKAPTIVGRRRSTSLLARGRDIDQLAETDSPDQRFIFRRCSSADRFRSRRSLRRLW